MADNLLKICKKCGIPQPLSEYFVDKSMKDGLWSKCKSCVFEGRPTKPCIGCGGPKPRGGQKYCDECRIPALQKRLKSPDKPCARCGEAEREMESYCRDCHNLIHFENRNLRTENDVNLCQNCYERPKVSGQGIRYCEECSVAAPAQALEAWAASGKALRASRKWKYRLSQEDAEFMILSQGGRCASFLCSTQIDERSAHVDHDHRCCSGTGPTCGECVRGLLCGSCNKGLGHFRDDPGILRSAADYLERYAL